MEQLKILVKVGQSARTVLRNCKAIRAITVDEMQYYLQTDDIDLLIIEKVNSEDCDRTSKIIGEYLNKSENPGKVIFNADSNDDDTLGIADEFSCDIVNNTNEVWSFVYKTFNVYVGRDIQIIAKDTDSAGLAASDVSSLFGTETVVNTYVDSDDIKLPAINSKSDIEDFDETTVREITKEQRRKIDLIKAHMHGTVDADDNQSEEDTSNPFASSEDSGVYGDNFDNASEELDVREESNASDGRGNSKNSEILLTRISKLNDTISRMQGKIDDIQLRLDKEVQLRTAVQDERDSLKARMAGILATKKVLEEKVPASEYRKIITKYNEVQEQLEHLQADNSSIEARSDAEIQKFKQEIEQLKRSVESKQSEIDQLNNSIISSANAESANATALQSRIDSLSSRLETSKADLESANAQIEEFKAQLAEKDRELGKLDKVEHHVEVSDKANEMHSEILENVLNMLRNYAQSNFDKDQLNADLQSSLEAEKSHVTDLMGSVSDRDVKIAKLNASIEDLNKQIEEANASVEERTRELTDENNTLRAKVMNFNTQISTLRNQLASKDNQYMVLAKTVGPTDPKTGHPRLFTNYKMLEAKNRELSSQVFTLNQQLSTALAESQTALKDRSRLTTENANLKRSLNAYINSGYSGAGGSGQMMPINYAPRNGRIAKIIVVFGTGSFGISLIAFSMAQKLAVQNSVLLMDFDLATPKLDSYFRTLPFVDVPGVPTKTTALELFLTQGMSKVWANATTVIPQKVSNKNGKLWWFPGLYNKVDDTAVLTADWTDLFRRVGGNFDYIVIDAGKFGYGGPNDQLTQNLCRIAYRTVVVSGNDYADVNSTVKAMHNKINRNNLVWILNKVPTTNVLQVVKTLLGNDRFELLPYSNDSFGKRSTLSMDKMLKGRFEGFLMNYIIPPKNKVGEV